MLRIKRLIWLIHFSKGNEAPAASVQVLYIPEGEESPVANDARVRPLQCSVNETLLTLFLVATSSSEIALGPFRETLFHGTRNAAC